MKRAWVVVIVVLCAVLGIPPSAFASGSYGAVVEKGVRGCTTDDLTGIVICFESPSVNPKSRGVFLQVWRAASPYFDWGHTNTATMRVPGEDSSGVWEERFGEIQYAPLVESAWKRGLVIEALL